MIQNFRNIATEDIFNGINSRDARKSCPAYLWKVAKRKLDLLNSARNLNDLRIPPGNHLEALKGDRDEQYSIRLNDQYRICFSWTTSGPSFVEIVDYH